MNTINSRVLLTSFDVWKAHHVSNASDDLITELLKRGLLRENVHLLRKVVVDFQLAPETIIAKIQQLQPDIVVCCGMAERRSQLTVESNGTVNQETIHTSVDIPHLIQNLPFTEISHNAGRFVCNHTYYTILKYLTDAQLSTDCVFIHVPILNSENLEAVVQDFSTLLVRLMAKKEIDCDQAINEYVRI